MQTIWYTFWAARPLKPMPVGEQYNIKDDNTIVVNGVVYKATSGMVPMSVPVAPVLTKEIACTTNSFYNSRKAPKGLLAFRQMGSEKVFGMGVAIKTDQFGVVILTARHVFDKFVEDVEIVGNTSAITLPKREVVCSGEVRENDFYLFKPAGVEILTFLSRIGVSAATAVKPFNSKKMVTVYGYDYSHGNQTLIYSTGITDSRAEQDLGDYTYHYANTLDGFSGTPLYDRHQNVIGIHVGGHRAKENKNLYIGNFWLCLGVSRETDIDPEELAIVDEPLEKWYRRRTLNFKGKKISYQMSDSQIYYFEDDTQGVHYGDVTEFLVDNYGSITRENEGASVSFLPDFQDGLRDQPKLAQKTVLTGGTQALPSNKKNKKPKKSAINSSKSEVGSQKELCQDSVKQVKFVLPKQEKLIPVLTNTGSPDQISRQSSTPSDSSRQDFTVSVVRLSRREDKVFNGVAHTRLWNRLLIKSTQEERTFHQRHLLLYVLGLRERSPSPRPERLVRDYLINYVTPLMASSSTPEVKNL